MMNDGVEEGTADGPEVDIPWAHRSQKRRLFPGDHQYDRFMGYLHRILEKHSAIFLLWVSCRAIWDRTQQGKI